MFILTSPILTIITILGLGLFYALIIGAQKTVVIRRLCLSVSFAALVVGALMGLSFDKGAVGYQYLSSFSFITEYNSSFALGVDGLSYVFLILTLFTFPFLFLAAWTVSNFPKHFFCHLLAMELLLVLTFVTVDLFYFFILFESLLIPMFILIGVWGARTRKIKAAYYFFLYTLFGSLFMLFGMIYLYQITGSLNYHVLLTEFLDADTQRLLWICLFLAFAVKMPLFPLHIWLPEAHVEAPTVGSMLLASLLLKLGGYGLLRFSLTFLASASVFFTPLVATLSIAGVIYGSLSTMRQIDLKRIIAYSSVAHMNLVGLGLFSYSRVGLEGSIYMMVAHGVVSAALFFCVGVIYDRAHTRLLRYYGGLVAVMPLFSSFFFVFSLANMGFPGTPNFVGELLMLTGIFSLSIAPVLLSASSVIFSSAYSTLLQARLTFGTLKTKYIAQFIDLLRRESAILTPLLGAATLLGVRTDFILAFIESAAWGIAEFGQASQFVRCVPVLLLTTPPTTVSFYETIPFESPAVYTNLLCIMLVTYLFLETLFYYRTVLLPDTFLNQHALLWAVFAFKLLYSAIVTFLLLEITYIWLDQAHDLFSRRIQALDRVLFFDAYHDLLFVGIIVERCMNIVYMPLLPLAGVVSAGLSLLGFFIGLDARYGLVGIRLPKRKPPTFRGCVHALSICFLGPILKVAILCFLHWDAYCRERKRPPKK